MGIRAQEEPVDRPGTPFFIHSAPVVGAAIPRTGGRLVALDAKGVLTGWDLSTGQRLYAHPRLPPGDTPRRLTCSPDGRFVAISPMGISPSEVVIFNLATGKELWRLNRCFSPVFSPDGELIAASIGSSIRRLRLQDGKELPILQEATRPLRWVAFSPDGKRLAATFQGGLGYAEWDLDLRTIVRGAEFQPDLPEGTALTYSPDGRTLWIATLWGAGPVGDPEGDAEVLSGPPLMFVEKGSRLVSGFRRKLLKIRDQATGRVIFELRLPLASPDYVEISDDGRLLMLVSGPGIHLEGLLARLDTPTEAAAVSSVGYAANGTALVAHAAGSLLRWDPGRHRELSRLKLPLPILSISQDGRFGISVKDEEELQVWDLVEGLELLKVSEPSRLLAWAISEDGSRLAVSTQAGRVSLWDIAGRKEFARVHNEMIVTVLAWSPGAKTIAWADALGSVVFAEGSSGREPLRFQSRGATITALLFLPDGTSLVSADRRGTLLSWKDELGREPVRIAAGEVPVTTMACSPDGRWLALAFGSTLRLHPLGRAGRTVEFIGHRKAITCLAFSPNGTELLSGGMDPTALVWRVPRE